MNIQMMMQQAEKMKREIFNAKKEVEEKEFLLEKELFEIKVNGKKEILQVKFKFENLEKEDIEILEDMIVVSLNEVFQNIDKEMNEKLKKYGPDLAGIL